MFIDNEHYRNMKDFYDKNIQCTNNGIKHAKIFINITFIFFINLFTNKFFVHNNILQNFWKIRYVISILSKNCNANGFYNHSNCSICSFNNYIEFGKKKL